MGDIADSPSPAQLMIDAVRRAGDDSGTGSKLLEKADSIQIANILSWRYRNPARFVADAIGADPRETVESTVGGNTPQLLVDNAAAAILRGERDVVIVAGAEAMYTRTLAYKSGARSVWETQPDETPRPTRVGDDRAGINDIETARSLFMPTNVYPVFENALRAAAGETIDEHQRKVSEMMARFSEVAAANPYGWATAPMSAEDIRTVGPDNRMVSFPYPKVMNANMQVDQGAALIICSVEAARAAGVPEDRWVFPWAGAEGHDHWFVSNRRDLHSSPAIGAIGRSLYAATGIGPDDIAHIDLYSCFPCAVEIGAAELGLRIDDPDRPLTLTGGLAFGGGPGNNYVTHSIAAMVDHVRAEPGSFGLVTTLGWYVTKHAAGIYSTTPPPAAFTCADVQDEVDATPSRELAGDDTSGAVTVESYTVIFERDGSPSLGVVASLLPDGRRVWSTTNDAGVAKAMTEEEFIGRPATVRAGGGIDL